MTNSETRLFFINNLKLLLIIAVVIIHSDLANELSVEHNFVCYVVDFISGTVCNSVAVPCFFITSAFLFFRNIKKFTAKVYLNKLYSRVHSLLIPYIIWNVIACTLFLFKVYKLHFDGLGIVEDGSLNWANFLTGFFYIDQAQSEPFAFAFWFIRNLLVFIVLSPIFRLISHDLITLMTTIAVFHILGFSTYYGEWFAFGAYLGLYHKDLALFNFNKGLWIVAAVFVASGCAMHYFMTYGQEGVLRAITHYVVVISAFILLLKWAKRIEHTQSLLNNSRLISATFFIYAFHQLFCRQTRVFWETFLGCNQPNSEVQVLTAYILTIVTLIGISFVVYLLFNRLSPKLMQIVTGGRQ